MSKLHLAEKWYPNSPDRDYRALKNLDNHLKVEHIPLLIFWLYRMKIPTRFWLPKS